MKPPLPAEVRQLGASRRQHSVLRFRVAMRFISGKSLKMLPISERSTSRFTTLSTNWLKSKCSGHQFRDSRQSRSASAYNASLQLYTLCPRLQRSFPSHPTASSKSLNGIGYKGGEKI
jgi:hypothetical protein